MCADEDLVTAERTLKWLRIEAGLRQEDVADRTGWGLQKVRRVEAAAAGELQGFLQALDAEAAVVLVQMRGHVYQIVPPPTAPTAQ